MFAEDNLDKLVNQQIIKQLSPIPDKKIYKNTDYIIPGKSVWRWYTQGTGNFQQEKEYIDYAYMLSFTYSLVDEGWEQWNDPWKKIRTLTQYADHKNVKIFVWKNSNELMCPTNNYALMLTFLDSVKSIGVAGIKVDFMNNESYSTIQFETKLLIECAKRRLMVNFHGCQAPAGESNTYPNEITREGIRGMELNNMQEGPIPAYHNAALPFTRYVVGHADYTPLSFTNPGKTTYAHQLATLICFTSSMQVIAEDPKILLNTPIISDAIEYIKSVPTTWDEIKVLPSSEIGKLAIIARRSGKEWYIGVLNGEEKKKEIEIDVTSLGKFTFLMLLQDDIDAAKVLVVSDNQ